MDGEEAAEAFFRCTVSMSNSVFLLSGHLWWAPFLTALHNWNAALKDWPGPIQRNPGWYSADDSYLYIICLLYRALQHVACG